MNAENKSSKTLKLTLNITLIIFVLFAIADLLTWLMAIGSGHKIPSGTINSFIASFLILVFMSGIIIWLIKRLNKRIKKDLEQV